jgi:hypothetical protein
MVTIESFSPATWFLFLPIVKKGDMLVECGVMLNNLVPTCTVRKGRIDTGVGGSIVI